MIKKIKRKTVKVSFFSTVEVALSNVDELWLKSSLKIIVISRIDLQVAREVLDAAARIIQPGVTTDEIDRVVHEATIAAGTNFNEFHFGKHSFKLSTCFIF